MWRRRRRRRRRALLGGLGMRRERRGEETARHGLRPQLAGLVASSGGLAGCLAAVVRVWGGAGRLWITGGAPSLLAHSLLCHPLVSAGCRGMFPCYRTSSTVTTVTNGVFLSQHFNIN